MYSQGVMKQFIDLMKQCIEFKEGDIKLRLAKTFMA